MGSMAKLIILRLGTNKIGNEGMQALSSAIANGALANLTKLWLHRNQIGDAGMKAFSHLSRPFRCRILLRPRGPAEFSTVTRPGNKEKAVGRASGERAGDVRFVLSELEPLLRARNRHRGHGDARGSDRAARHHLQATRHR